MAPIQFAPRMHAKPDMLANRPLDFKANRTSPTAPAPPEAHSRCDQPLGALGGLDWWPL